MPKFQYILEFSQIDKDDASIVGEKASNLGEMTQEGLPVPPGFVIPAKVYQLFIAENDIEKKIDSILSSINFQNHSELFQASENIQKLIVKQPIPKEVAKEISKRYQKMGGVFRHALVSVRPSVQSKFSFSGEHETYLNIQGEASVLESIRKCWASLFTPRAILYREEKKEKSSLEMSVVIQQMIESFCSGMAFTKDPQGKNKNTIIIEAIWGLGQLISDGDVIPDRYTVDRLTGDILNIEKSEQKRELVKKGKETKLQNVAKSRFSKQKLEENDIKNLWKLLQKIHKLYFFPQIVEWAFKDKKLYILETDHLNKVENNLQTNDSRTISNNVDQPEKVILKGIPVSSGLVTGIVRVINKPQELSKINKGEILVVPHISPDFVPFIKKVLGVITDQGGLTSHAAVMAREFGVPCIVGAEEATSKLKTGEVITMNGKEGWVVKGHKGIHTSDSQSQGEIKPDENIKTATKIYVNMSDPQNVHEVSQMPVEGVGILRGEFLISQIGIHPKHLIKNGKQKILVDKLTESLEKFCESFDSGIVVYRTSDFKTNEYRNLEGGKAFEPVEDNPMLGVRGAFRYITDPQVFELELQAVKKVREKYKNLHVCIPFVRTPQELLEVKKIMASNGLMRGPSFKIWMMVELPVNVLLIEDFINVGIDGISVGTNDLTMLLSGIDRDNNDLSASFNELNPAVLWSIERVIKAAQNAGITSSVCGQAASTYDSLVEDLVRLGITSISVNPDAIGRVQKVIHETERKIGK
jgi:pyruvate, water dikinase